MRYVSTRGAAPALDFEGVLLAGLAEDGGLYVPESWPRLEPEALRALRGLPYAEVGRPDHGAVRRRPASPPANSGADGAGLCRLRPCRRSRRCGSSTTSCWLLELFHGPTLAFKDWRCSWSACMFDHVLARRGERVTIVGATSGDTGSAAIAACRDRERLDIFILHPQGRISEVQRRQMTTVAAANVHAIAIEGTFDDCQDIVKALFADRAFRDELNLVGGQLDQLGADRWRRSSITSPPPWRSARPTRRVAFAVPTGNFGNVFAGYAARRMGLPIERLIVGSNRNDILARFFETGDMSLGAVAPDLEPQHGHPGLQQLRAPAVRAVRPRRRGGRRPDRRRFGETGASRSEPNGLARGAAAVRGRRVDDDGDRCAPSPRPARDAASLIDPHTAVGVRGGAREAPRGRERADRRAGHRPSGQVPRCGRARHRHSAAAAGALADLRRAGAVHRSAERRRGGAGASSAPGTGVLNGSAR